MDLNQRTILIDLGIDVDRTIARFSGNEALFIKFLGKYLEDHNAELLKKAYERLDCEAIENAAHTLKGIAGNLGMTALYHLCNTLVQELRSGSRTELSQLCQTVVLEHERLTKGLQAMLGEPS